jgi:hypothetical protein
MPTSETIVDLIYEEIKKKNALPVPEVVAKKAIAGMVEALNGAGWQIYPPGSIVGPSAAREFVGKIGATSYFCPGCGTHRPSYGIHMQNAEFPGIGLAGIMTLFCAVDSCRRIHQVTILPPLTGKVQ